MAPDQRSVRAETQAAGTPQREVAPVGRLRPRNRPGSGERRRTLGIALGLALLVLLSAAGGAVGYAWWLDRQGIGPGAPESARDVFGTFWQAWRIVEANYVDPTAAEPRKLTWGAIRGMVDALGDEGHSRFLTPREVELEEENLSGEFVGIGAEVSISNGRPTIVAPYDDSPAERAGLRAGDVILAVDGQSTERLSLDELVARVRGPAGTSVRLTVLRPTTQTVEEVTVPRERIEVAAVRWALLPVEGIAHVRLAEFSQGAADELRAALLAARERGARAIVLDVRDNPGGLLDEAVAVTSQFIDTGNVLLERDRSGRVTPYPARPGGAGLELRLAVLVNRGSASSAEVLVGALQDAGRATIVGETTFGTGTVLESFPLDDGSAILLGVAEWLTPRGRLIRGRGIQPDIVVPLPQLAEPLSPPRDNRYTPEAYAGSNDDQLKRAVDALAPVPAPRSTAPPTRQAV